MIKYAISSHTLIKQARLVKQKPRYIASIPLYVARGLNSPISQRNSSLLPSAAVVYFYQFDHQMLTNSLLHGFTYSLCSSSLLLLILLLLYSTVSTFPCLLQTLYTVIATVLLMLNSMYYYCKILYNNDNGGSRRDREKSQIRSKNPWNSVGESGGGGIRECQREARVERGKRS